MRHVIPPEVLRKSHWVHGRGRIAQARAHKYIRREPTGKFTPTGATIWRYYYRDERDRAAGQQHDPGGEHKRLDQITDVHARHVVQSRTAEIVRRDLEDDNNRPDYTRVSKHPADKFYQFSNRGRLIYARIGPTDEQARQGDWSWRPGIDKVARGNLKELYDEDGRALNTHQAGLWLRQDEWDWKAQKKPDDVPDRLAVKGAYSEKFNAATLDFWYNYTLGIARKPVAGPHPELPNEISPQEFRIHSGAFAYDGFRKTRTAGNTLTFQNENPDGSLTEVLVHAQSGQLMDSLMQRLVNPRNQVVRNARDLSDLFRQAARERTTAWVTIDATKSGAIERHYYHAQLQFDGRGQPRVLGAYWAKKLGKKEPRLDDLLNRYGKIEAERIRRTSAKRIPLDPGNPVEYFDPSRGKWLPGKFVATNPKTAEHGRSFSVQSKSGQQFEVSRVRRVYDEQRDVLALRGDLLLHFVPGDRGGYKFLLPTDGSVKLEDLKGVPHVTVDEEAGTASLDDPGKIDEVRTAIGGFSIDELAVDQLDSKLRALEEAEKRRRRGDDVLPKEFVKALGDGTYDFSGVSDWNVEHHLREHQIAFFKRLVAAGGRMLAAHHVGCLSGETLIPCNRGGKGFKITIRDLIEKHAVAVPGGVRGGKQQRWNSNTPTLCRSVFGDHLRLNDVVDAVASGVKETFCVRTRGGRVIRATAEHPFWTPNGWVALRDLRPGDPVHVHGDLLRGRVEKHRYAYVDGMRHHPYASKYGRTWLHRLVIEAHQNDLSLDRFIDCCRTGRAAGLKFIDPAVFAVHHRDGNHENNTIENLEVQTHIDHWTQHGRESGFGNFAEIRVGTDIVSSIGETRIEETFDLIMNPESQSYSANGFVVHNTGKTPTSIAVALGLRQLGKLRDPGDPSKPHPLAEKLGAKKTLIVVPPNVLKNWQNEIRKFDTGAQIIANPANAKGAFRIERAMAAAKAGDDPYFMHVTNPEYLREHEAEFKKMGYDFLIVDEAHRVTGKAAGGKRTQINEVLRGLSAQVKGMVMLSGTPVTNNLRTLPEYVDLLSNGQVKLGAFESEYLMPDPITGAVNTHVKPEKAAELAAIMGGMMDVVTARDVKGAVMPLSRMDDVIPARIQGLQASMVRMYTAELSSEERAQMEDIASLDVDERSFLSAESQRAVNKARGVLLAVGFKPASENRNMRYSRPTFEKDEKTGKNIVVEKPVDAHYPRPDLDRWPTVWHATKDESGRPARVVPGRGEVHEGLATIWDRHVANEVGADGYAALAGTRVTEAQRAKLRDWANKPIENPDFGPEGVICRGESVNDARGQFAGVRDIEAGGSHVKIGERWYADADHSFYREADFDRETQKPKEGARDVLTHPEMRGERRKVDLALTTGNAYTDHLEEHINSVLHPEVGDPDAQMIHFAHNITAGLRTMEAKLRTMGYADVNEALEDLRKNPNAAVPSKFFVAFGQPKNTRGNRDLNSAMFQKVKVQRWPPVALVDEAEIPKYDRAARKLGHSSYSAMAGGLVDFRTQVRLDSDPELSGAFPERLRDTDAPDSEFVAKTDMHRQVAEAERTGRPQPTTWTPDDRKAIRKEFGIRAPIFVRVRDGRTEYHYGGPGVAPAMEDFESFNPDTPEYERAAAKLDQVLRKGWTTDPPMTAKQHAVFNNVQHMVATDAANVGLNWGNAVNVTLFDTPFTPAAEQQRIGRAARALQKPQNRKIVALLDKVDRMRAEADRELRDRASRHEVETGQMRHVLDSDIMTEVAARLTNDERRTLRNLKYMVDVKRMVAHIDEQDPDTGEWRTVPVRAQQRVIQFQRGKAAGQEDFIRMLQTAGEPSIPGRYVHASDATLRAFAKVTPKTDAAKSLFVVPEDVLQKARPSRKPLRHVIPMEG